jgi:hypothetical protein
MLAITRSPALGCAHVEVVGMAREVMSALLALVVPVRPASGQVI